MTKDKHSSIQTRMLGELGLSTHASLLALSRTLDEHCCLKARKPGFDRREGLSKPKKQQRLAAAQGAVCTRSFDHPITS